MGKGIPQMGTGSKTRANSPFHSKPRKQKGMLRVLKTRRFSRSEASISAAAKNSSKTNLGLKTANSTAHHCTLWPKERRRRANEHIPHFTKQLSSDKKSTTENRWSLWRRTSSISKKLRRISDWLSKCSSTASTPPIPTKYPINFDICNQFMLCQFLSALFLQVFVNEVSFEIRSY